MKRVLLITTSYPEQSEGEAAAGVFVRDFARALTTAGISVEVIAPASTDYVSEDRGVTETRFAVPHLPLSLLNPAHVKDWPAIFSTLTRGKKTVSDVCAQRRPDHILALWALPSGAWAQRASNCYGIPYSTWALGSDIWTLGKIPVLRQYLGYVMRHAQHRFADGLILSKAVEAICRRQCRFLASSRDFRTPPNRSVSIAPPYRLAFLGRWHSNKGIDLLIDALDSLSEQDWASIACVKLHGGGPLVAQVLERTHELQRAGRPVEVGGYLDLKGARELFGWSDYVMIPSRIESIPVVFSDAMQAGRPVICSPVGDLPNLIEKYKCGVVATRPTAADLADAIRAAITGRPDDLTAGVLRASFDFDTTKSAFDFLNETNLARHSMNTIAHEPNPH